MCVIFVADKERPTEKMVADAFEHNNAGAGIAWREMVKDEETGAETMQIVWEKGLDLARIQELCKEAPMPFIAHFRIPTVGGRVATLTHPFPIDAQAPLFLRGRTPGAVLFHNGHWGSWKDLCVRAAVSGNGPIPNGEWSDSRAMAWIASITGIRIFEFIEEKVAVFPATEEIEIFGNGWSRLNNVLVSNQLFHRTYSHTNSTVNGTDKKYCANRSCARKDIDNTGYCPLHTKLTPVVDDKQVTGTQQTVTEGGNTSKKLIVLPGAEDEGSGGDPNPDPFRGTVPTPLQRASQTYSDACRRHAAGKLSKNKMKKARHAWDVAQEKYRLDTATAITTAQTLH